MKSIKLLLAILVLSFSCQHQKESGVESLVQSKNEKKDKIAHQFAKILASSMSDSRIREFIKEETSSQFDGDYNFLFELSKDKEIQLDEGRTESITFANLLCSGNGNLRVDDQEYALLLNQLETEYPTMQISVPQLEDISVEDWNTSGFVPMVAVLNSDFDEHTTKFVTAYNELGEQFLLSVDQEPEHLVVVISQSETVLAFELFDDPYIGQMRSFCEQPMALYTSDSFNFYLDSDLVYYQNCLIVGDSDISGSPTTGGNQVICDRDDKTGENRRDVLLKAKFKSKEQMRTLERWIQGKPEMYVFIVFAKNNNTRNPQFSHTIKGADKKGWYHRNLFGNVVLDMNKLNIPVVTWDKEVYGKTMRYYWMEKDKPWLSARLKFDLNTSVEILETEIVEVFAQGSVEFSIGGKWDNGGDAFVEYCSNTDDVGTKYSTGFLDFWVNQENSL
jgi:hypothetical protein